MLSGIRFMNKLKIRYGFKWLYGETYICYNIKFVQRCIRVLFQKFREEHKALWLLSRNHTVNSVGGKKKGAWTSLHATDSQLPTKVMILMNRINMTFNPTRLIQCRNVLNSIRIIRMLTVALYRVKTIHLVSRPTLQNMLI